MDRIIRIIEKTSDWASRASALLLFLMTLLILTEIFLWNAFSKTTLIADEYAAYGLAAIVFLGAGYCLKEKGQIRITLILGLMPKKAAAVVTCLATAVVTVFMGYILWYLYLMVNSTFRYGSTSGTLTNTPLWIPQAVMLLGAFQLLDQLAGTTLKTCRAISSGEEVV